MSIYQEVSKDILIKAMEEGYIPKLRATDSSDALDQNLKSITNAYKEIFKAVTDPPE